MNTVSFKHFYDNAVSRLIEGNDLISELTAIKLNSEITDFVLDEFNSMLSKPDASQMNVLIRIPYVH